MNNDFHQEKKLLVIGDWLFDESWVTGEHRGVLSSHVGGDRLRAIHDYDASLCDLAGAGLATCILSCALNDKKVKEKWKILGAGVWDRDDTPAIQSKLASGPCAHDSNSPYRIIRSYSGRWDYGELLNIGQLVETKPDEKPRLSGKKSPVQARYRCGTIRALRVYRHKNGKIELKERIDWDMPLPHDLAVWIDSNAALKAVLKEKELERKVYGGHSLLDFVKDLDAIVVQDMKKGVISATLIKKLAEVATKARWFISTKAWRPQREPAISQEEPHWLRLLEDASVELLLIPRLPATRAVDEGYLNCWITRNGVASREALDTVNDLSRRFGNSAIVVMPNGLTILARGRAGGDNKGAGFIQIKPGNGSSHADEDSPDVDLPISTVTFPSIVAWLLRKPGDLEAALKHAVQVTHVWLEREMKAITGSSKKEDEPCRMKFWDVPEDQGLVEWRPVEWKESTARWRQALEDCGIIYPQEKNPPPGDTPRIELWRAMTDIDGYVCCVPSKSDAIQRIKQELALFNKEPRPRGSRSFMLVADPGSGKTHLAKELARACNFSLVHFNITQMPSKNDLLDCFDTIVTRQAHDEKKLLVFFDEINARLDGQHVYHTFLAPLEESTYTRGGKTFRMGACAWLFVGTENPELHADKSVKGSDFVSRLSLLPIAFRPELGEEPNVDTERVYLGVSLLMKTFPDVREVTEKVLRAFEFLRTDVDARKIRRLVESFASIQNEKVLSSNIPRDQMKELTYPHDSHRHHFTKWDELPEGDTPILIKSKDEREEARLPAAGGKLN